MDLRQIDALVAKQVMEERVIDIPFIPNTVCPETALFTDEAASEWRKRYPHSCPIKTIPRYSSKIAAAWQVVERMIALGYRLDIRWLLSNQWDVIFEKWPDPRRISKTDPSCALAICLAALRAVGVEVPQDA